MNLIALRLAIGLDVDWAKSACTKFVPGYQLGG